jgi:hypothetical protein
MHGEPRLNRDEETTQETNAAIRAKQRREHFDVIWYGTVGRNFRYAALFIVILLLIFGVLMGVEKYSM